MREVPTLRQGASRAGAWMLACGVLAVCVASGCREERADVSASSRPTASAPAGGGANTVTSNGGSFEITYAPTPDPMPMNEPFKLDVTLKQAGGASSQAGAPVVLRVDAGMPAHGHGMNTRPRVTETGDGKYLVEGMLFHMPGHWQLYFDIRRGAVVERAQADIHLE